MAMGFWELIKAYTDDTGATEASIMRRANLNKGAFTSWRARGIPVLPSQAEILAIARAIRADYETVLQSILYETLYLPEEVAVAQARIARADELDLWRDIKRCVDSLLASAGGDRQAALRSMPRRPLDDMRKARIMLNAREVLAGRLSLPDDVASDLSDTTELREAAHRPGEPAGGSEFDEE